MARRQPLNPTEFSVTVVAIEIGGLKTECIDVGTYTPTCPALPPLRGLAAEALHPGLSPLESTTTSR